MKRTSPPNSTDLRGGNDIDRASFADPGLCVTVISTTNEGTTAALNAARWLGKDLKAQITLLTLEPARFHFPDQPPLLFDATTMEPCPVMPRLSAQEEEAGIRVCLCRYSEGDLQRVFRRRAVVVIGGKRHWWLSAEEKLEKALRHLGHHVIFVDVGNKTDRASHGRFPHFLEDDATEFHKQAGAA